MIKWGTISMVLVVVLVSSCSSTKNGENSDREDLTAKELLQGVWLDDETDMPLMRISGDTIYYADLQNAPVYFKVLLDKLAGVIGILIKFLSLFGSNTHKSCIHGWSCYFAITAIFCSRSRIEHSAAH